MNRRSVLATAVAVSIAGCIDATGRTSPATDSVDPIVDPAVEERVKECEKQHIRDEVVVREDETIDDLQEPQIVDTDVRTEGAYVALETRFATIRSSEDEPDLHMDSLVAAYYLVSDGEIFRTSDEEADPLDGTLVDC